MTIQGIKKFLDEHADDAEVSTFVDSLADKRVDQARKRWEKELPGKVDKEIERRAVAAKKREELDERIDENFADAKLDPAYARAFLPPEYVGADEETLESMVHEATERATAVLSVALRDRISGSPKGGGEVETPDPKVAEFRKGMGLT